VVTAAMRLEFGDLREWGRVRAGAVNLYIQTLASGAQKIPFIRAEGRPGGIRGITMLSPSLS